MAFTLAVGASHDVGRGNVVGPVAERPRGILETIGTATGNSLIGTLGTIGDAVISAVVKPRNGDPGRATASTVGNSLVPVLPGVAVAARGMLAMWPRVAPWVGRAARLLVQSSGVIMAAEILGITPDHAAHLATRKRRGRGISAADLRRTRRTLCTLERFQSYLHKPRRRKCA